jgi:hypothetical protein
MSLKIERDTFQQGVQRTGGGAVGGVASALLDGRNPPQIPGTTGRHPIAEAVGTAITGGRQNAGTKGYLAVCRLRFCLGSVGVAL